MKEEKGRKGTEVREMGPEDPYRVEQFVHLRVSGSNFSTDKEVKPHHRAMRK